jgi:hypothetical protein
LWCWHWLLADEAFNAAAQFIQIEDGGGQGAGKGNAAGARQRAPGHSAAVTGASWSGARGKLASGDAAGTIIVWARKGDAWAQEMKNERLSAQRAHWLMAAICNGPPP